MTAKGLLLLVGFALIFVSCSSGKGQLKELCVFSDEPGKVLCDEGHEPRDQEEVKNTHVIILAEDLPLIRASESTEDICPRPE